MSSLCANCIKNTSLEAVIVKSGTVVDACAVCGATNVSAINSTQQEFKSKFRALIRYHFSEWHYNTHMGGNGLEALFFSGNPITNYKSDWNPDAYEGALLVILDPAYEDYDKGISLFAGYTDGLQNMPLVALKNDFDHRLAILREQSRWNNYFFLDEEAKALITPHISDVEKDLKEGTVLFRSRLGFETRATPLMGWGDERHYRPHSANSISAPPPYVAGAGRMNRGGVSFLYLATSQDTALAEIRPHPGHFCSVGSFEATSDLRVADLSSLDACNYSASDEQLDEYLLLKSLDDLFSIPITPERRGEYHITQLLTDAFRHLGFDGVCYRSSVAHGKNYVIFDPKLFTYVPNSGLVFKIQSLNYRHEQMSSMADDDDYMTNLDGTFR